MKNLTPCLAAALVAACGNRSEPSQQSAALISDGAHSGRAGFYFLPPLVAQPRATGTFDPAFAPRITVRDLATGTTVATFESPAISVDPVEQQYRVNWDTGRTSLDSTHTYRIEVWLYTFVVGFADVDVVDSGKQLKNVDTDEYIALLDGRTLPIKFRLDRGVIDDLIPRVFVFLSPLVDGFTAGNGSATFSASLPNLSLTCTLNGADVPCSVGTPLTWSSLGDGSTLRLEVSPISNDTGIPGPKKIATAIVDAVAPSVENLSIVDGSILGPSMVLQFSSSDATAAFACTLDISGPYEPCAPGVPVGVILPDGNVEWRIVATDPVGNQTISLRSFNVDAVGPIFDLALTRVPVDAACPASTAATEIQFQAADRSPPVTYLCSLDAGAARPCSEVSPMEGAFRWAHLAAGSHSLRVIAFDRFLNPSAWPLELTFAVDRQPPALHAEIIGVPTGQGHVATSGGAGLGEIHLSATETAHLPVALTLCEIHSTGPTHACACADESASGDGTFWVCRFANLSDAHNLHQAAMTAQDSCGSVNETVAITDPWLVDSTPDRIEFVDLVAGPGGAVKHRGSAGPEGDIVRPPATVQFAVHDDAVDEFDSSAAPLLRQCTIDSDWPANCPEAVALDIATEGPHTFTVSFSDAVGNPSVPARFVFYVDRTAPGATLGNVLNSAGDEGPCVGRPGCEGCVSATGLPVTDHDGRIAFSADEPPSTVPDFVTFTCSLAKDGSSLPGDNECVFEDGRLQTGASCAANCIPTNAPWNGTGYQYSGLGSGTYVFTLTAVDGVGNQTTRTTTFVVDGTAPVLTYISPPAPRGGTRDEGIVPAFVGVETVGTFQADADASTNPVDYTCTIDGIATTCGSQSGNLTYVIPASASEGQHTAHVSAVDCAGNVNRGTDQSFQLDRDAPQEVARPVVLQSTPLADGRVTFSFSVRDAISNIATLTCSIDGTLDPACSASPRTTALAPSLPTTGGSYAGTASIAELSAGEHVLTYTAMDAFGHTLNGAPLTFLVTHGEDTGWVALFGQDFDEDRDWALSLPIRTDDAIGPILGNILMRSKAASFTLRPFRILRVVSTATTAASVGHSALDICERFWAVRGSLCDCSSAAVAANNACIQTAELTIPNSAGNAAATLRAAMRGYDAILIADLNNSTLATAVANDAAWLQALQTPLTSADPMPGTGAHVSGGIIVVLDGPGSNTWRTLGAGPGNLLHVSASEAASRPPTGPDVAERDCLDAAFDDVASIASGPLDSYWMPENAAAYSISDGETDTTALFVASTPPGAWKPILLLRRFGVTPMGACVERAH